MISWLMDRLSDRVNHGYWYAPDPHSITNNHYGQWGQPEENNMATNSTVAIPYNIYPSSNLQGSANIQFCGSTGGVGSLSGITTVLPNSYQGSFTIPFTDASGSVWALAVDQAYISTMMQISQAHQMKATNGQTAQQAPPLAPFTPSNKSHTSPCMLEGDFTEGEMELAETIISELEGGNDKRYNKDIQEDISCQT